MLLEHQLKEEQSEKTETALAEENTEKIKKQIWFVDHNLKKIYLDGTARLADTTILDFTESFINESIYVLPQNTRDVRVIQTFDRLAANVSSNSKNSRYDIFSFNTSVKLYGVALFLKRFVLVQEKKFKLQLKLRNLSTGVYSELSIDFDQNSEAGIRKIWADQIVEVNEG